MNSQTSVDTKTLDMADTATGHTDTGQANYKINRCAVIFLNNSCAVIWIFLSKAIRSIKTSYLQGLSTQARINII